MWAEYRLSSIEISPCLHTCKPTYDLVSKLTGGHLLKAYINHNPAQWALALTMAAAHLVRTSEQTGSMLSNFDYCIDKSVPFELFSGIPQ